ncbi:conserved hypothetical protein [Culex quinquefasciatus]|uniref:Chaperonin n=1 Tax=Culex quinquefasciatus TaxID=7176 RepID=B0X921_CULQU|nr:conserved hypothetical protein [Culex quinquefasciatus]|eukprot:XP_001866143.1 conserved hypothetical protein [Culex quinquefasciatus]
MLTENGHTEIDRRQRTRTASKIPAQRSAGRPKKDPNAPKAKYKRKQDKAAAAAATLQTFAAVAATSSKQQALLPFAAGQQQLSTFMPVPKYHERDIRTQMPILYATNCCSVTTPTITGSTRLGRSLHDGPEFPATATEEAQKRQGNRVRHKAALDGVGANKYHHLRGTAAENHLKNIGTAKAVTKMQGLSREACSNQRRLLTAFGASTESELLKISQKQFVKSAIHDWGRLRWNRLPRTRWSSRTWAKWCARRWRICARPSTKRSASAARTYSGSTNYSPTQSGAAARPARDHDDHRRDYSLAAAPFMDPEIVVQNGHAGAGLVDAEAQLYHLEMVLKMEMPKAAPAIRRKASSTTPAEEVVKSSSKLLMVERVAKMCTDLLALKPGVVFTEKGVSDLAHHFLLNAGITAILRLHKTKDSRVACAIVNQTLDHLFRDAFKEIFNETERSRPKLANRAAKKAKSDPSRRGEGTCRQLLCVHQHRPASWHPPTGIVPSSPASSTAEPPAAKGRKTSQPSLTRSLTVMPSQPQFTSCPKSRRLEPAEKRANPSEQPDTPEHQARLPGGTS